MNDEKEEKKVFNEEKKKRLECYSHFFSIVGAICLVLLGVRAIDFNTTEYWWVFVSGLFVSSYVIGHLQSMLEKM